MVSSVPEDPEVTGHIGVTIPYQTYWRILAYLVAIQRIASILEGWVRRLNL